MDNTKNSMTVSEFLSGETTLDKLKIGTGGIIKQVGGEKELRHRLLDMGLTPKTHVFLKKAAPMGDPIELTLRKEDASRITIIPDKKENELGGDNI